MTRGVNQASNGAVTRHHLGMEQQSQSAIGPAAERMRMEQIPPAQIHLCPRLCSLLWTLTITSVRALD